MRENVTISYRGASYEIGRGNDFYGIWANGAPASLPPLEWWPETAEGWSAAWSRFTAIEAPGSIVQAGGPGAPGSTQAPGWGSGTSAPGSGTSTLAPSRGAHTVTSSALLAVGVVLGLVGLFPGYLSGQSLASQPANLVPHLIYLAAWTASAVLIMRGGRLQQAGALIGTGVSAVTLGLFLTDVGQRISGSIAGAGLWLGVIGWLACTAGAGYALWAGRAGRPARPQGRELGPIVLVLLAGLGAAIAFAPSWDSYLLRDAAGASQSVTLGNAFANPAAMIAGSVVTMVALVAVVVAAALWRPPRHGALLLAGAVIPLLAQAISAMVQTAEATSPALFGYTSAQAQQIGLTISNGLTAVFWVFCVFVVALAAACTWMFVTNEGAARTPSGRIHVYPYAHPAAWWSPNQPAPGDATAQAWRIASAGQPAPAGQATSAAPGTALGTPEAASASTSTTLAPQGGAPAPAHDEASAAPQAEESQAQEFPAAQDEGSAPAQEPAPDNGAQDD